MATVIFEERASVWIERPFFFITYQTAKIYSKTMELKCFLSSLILIDGALQLLR